MSQRRQVISISKSTASRPYNHTVSPDVLRQFEVYPRPSHWETYLDNAKMLRPELVQVDGFIDSRKGSNALALLCCREALATASALGKR